MRLHLDVAQIEHAKGLDHLPTEKHETARATAALEHRTTPVSVRFEMGAACVENAIVDRDGPKSDCPSQGHSGQWST